MEAPDDIQCFQFSPTDPHVIAGGCVNGQVVMWDIKEYEERIKNPRGDHRDKDLFIEYLSERLGIINDAYTTLAISQISFSYIINEGFRIILITK